ncbi:lipoprotein [uncultured Clostridium sp.]|uniref:lipoprotein n=1 Tax=uncultured Clostridium sp. TaxID=59620 RepID=UPI0025CD2917|nr:lipoprotein [uncultured Clostridium sp.]
MKKKLLCLICASFISATLISCGHASNENVPSGSVENTENSSTQGENSEKAQSSAILDSPTADISKIVSVDELKEKDSASIASVLGNPTEQQGNDSTYEKDDYIFDVTYYDGVCGQVKITPKTTLEYPADATNSLKVLGITAGDADSLSPSHFIWNNQFDTYSITVLPDDTTGKNIKDITVIFDEKYK